MSMIFSKKNLKFSHPLFASFVMLCLSIFFAGVAFGEVTYQTLFKKIAPKKPEDLKNMILIPEGECEFGSIAGEVDEVPVVTRKMVGFYIDKYEVTNREYKRFLKANPEWNRKNIAAIFKGENYLGHWINNGSYPDDLANHPVTNITWFSAKAFCLWKGKRLPKELEWEKAASFNLLNSDLKMKHKYKWSFGDKFEPDAANTAYYHGLEIGGFWADWWSIFKRDLTSKILKGMTTTSVGSFQAGCNNIFDMTGNVWEWCDDVYEGDAYKKIAYVNSIGSKKDISEGTKTATFNYLYEPPHSGKSFDIETQRYRVVRGGSWVDDQEFSRTTNRFKFRPENADNDIGFRCACDLIEEEKTQEKQGKKQGKKEEGLALQSPQK